MAVPFKTIPANLRLPLFFAELDPSRANSQPATQRALLIGQRLAGSPFPANAPFRLSSAVDAKNGLGRGSVIGGMIDAYRANDPTGDVWVLPIDDDPAAQAATGTVTFGGAATAFGVVALYVAGFRVASAVPSGLTAAQIATQVTADVNATLDVPVTATSAGAVVTFTARNKGECGNDVDLRVNFAGAAAGEALPAGVTAVIAPMAGGAVNPSLTAPLGALPERAFDFIVSSLTDAIALQAVIALLNDQTGRWSYSVQQYGHAMVAKRGTAGAVAAFATALNAQHLSVIAFNDSPSPAWVWAAAFFGAVAVSVRADPAVPLQYLGVRGVLAPPLASRYPAPIRNNTLLYGGCATWTVDPTGTVTTENLVTTYTTNALGQADNSYLEVETLFQLAFVLRRMSSVVTAKFGRVKLAADGARLLPGSNVVTPATIRAELIAQYRQLEAEGQVQQSADFAAALVVEKDATNPNRVNVLWPGTLIGQLRTFALLAQFRLI